MAAPASNLKPRQGRPGQSPCGQIVASRGFIRAISARGDGDDDPWSDGFGGAP